MRTLSIIQPGLSSTVQDLGRPGHSAMGIAPAGAADRLSLRIGNRLLGNAESAAAIEMTLTGEIIEVEAGAVVCLAGAAAPDARIEREGTARRLDAWTPTPVRAGSIIRIGPLRGGARALLCFDGGIDTPAVLGSRSAHTPSGIGGGPLSAGTELALGDPVRGLQLAPLESRLRAQVREMLDRTTLRITPGAQHDRFAPGAIEGITASGFTVGDRSDRMGLRLLGSPVEPPAGSIRSEGVVTGCIQIPPGGEPIALLVDRPATGGYPVIACVIRADLPALGQRRPRDTIRFEWADRPAAIQAASEQERLVRSVPLPRPSPRASEQQHQQQQ